MMIKFSMRDCNQAWMCSVSCVYSDFLCLILFCLHIRKCHCGKHVRIEDAREEQTVCTINLMHVFVYLCFGSRAKGIKTKLGTLLQKPENAIDLIIPYPEKPEKKPEKLQK